MIAAGPLWLVFAWHSSLNGLTSSTLEQNIASLRSLVVHEILHGLGFSNSQFNYARSEHAPWSPTAPSPSRLPFLLSSTVTASRLRQLQAARART